MIYGIIDIGSNTIRLSIYRCEENEKVTRLINKKTMAGLASYVKNGEITKSGIKKACEVLNEYKEIIENLKIEKSFVFATASLRNVTNTDAAVLAIKEKTGFNVDVVLGEDEGIYDFIGATKVMDVSDGILVDIGGGSTEIVVYENKKIIKSYSIPVGSLSMYSKHVSGLLPTVEERIAIKCDVLCKLKEIDGLKPNIVACGVGGTIRAVGKIQEIVLKEEIMRNVIKREHIKKIIKKCDNSRKIFLNKILKVVPDRVHTVVPGLIILNSIVKFYDIKEIHISSYGVREGYLFSKVLGGKYNE